MKPAIGRQDNRWFDEARSLFAAGMPAFEIARKFDVSTHRVRMVCEPAFAAQHRARGVARRMGEVSKLQRSRNKTGWACGGEARWRGRIPIPEHTHPLVRQFIRHLNDQQTTITEVAERAGYRKGTVSSWRYTQMPRLDNFANVLEVLGLELVIREIRL